MTRNERANELIKELSVVAASTDLPEFKANREVLYRKGKPVFRETDLDDVRWAWVNLKVQGHDIDPDAMVQRFAQYAHIYNSIITFEDENSRFQEGRGPVGIVLATRDAWRYQPHVLWMDWATKRNKLRCVVGFLTRLRYDKTVGVTIVHCSQKWVQFYRKLGDKYVPTLELAGRIPNGTIEGDDWVFSMRGRKSNKRKH